MCDSSNFETLIWPTFNYDIDLKFCTHIETSRHFMILWFFNHKRVLVLRQNKTFGLSKEPYHQTTLHKLMCLSMHFRLYRHSNILMYSVPGVSIINDWSFPKAYQKFQLEIRTGTAWIFSESTVTSINFPIQISKSIISLTKANTVEQMHENYKLWHNLSTFRRIQALVLLKIW
jgi:hypothetical protein